MACCVRHALNPRAHKSNTIAFRRTCVELCKIILAALPGAAKGPTAGGCPAAHCTLLAQAVCNVGALTKRHREVPAGAEHLLLLAAVAVELEERWIIV